MVAADHCICRVPVVGGPRAGKTTFAARRAASLEGIERFGRHLRVTRLGNDREAGHFLATVGAG